MDIDSIYYLGLVQDIAGQLPEAMAGTSYGTPAFKVKGKLFTRFKEDGKTLVVFTNERDKWMKKDPAAFFITDHYLNYPMLLIDLSKVNKKTLVMLIKASWRMRADKTILKKHPTV